MRRQQRGVGSDSSNRNRNIILAVLAVVAIGAAVYFLAGGQDPDVGSFVEDEDWGGDSADGSKARQRDGAGRPASKAGGTADGSVSDAADTPAAAAAVPELVEEEEEEASEEDLWVRRELEALFGADGLARVYPSSNALPRLIAVAASVSEGAIIARQVRFWRPEGKFPVRHSGGLIYVDPAGYRRFAPLVNILISVDPQALANLFNRLEPTLQTAYRQLGYRRGNVRTVLRAAIDRVLDAPIRPGRIALVRPTVQYHYAERSLERMDPISKQMLRMGPQNTRKLQSWLKRLRPSL